MANSDRWYSGETQIYWCCRALLEGRSINHRTEIREARGWRLAAICHRLKSEFGWPIMTEFKGPQNLAHYQLASGTDLSRLRFPPSAQSLADEQSGGAV